MSGTITTFTPTANVPFQFQAALSGPTAIVDPSVVGPDYNIAVLWNTAGQRWYMLIVDQNGTLIVNRPLVASPPGYDINLVGGYFTGSTLVYLDGLSQFVVTP